MENKFSFFCLIIILLNISFLYSKRTIPILYSIDSKVIYSCLVSITSLCHNANRKKTFYKIHVLVTPDFFPPDYEKLQDISNSQYLSVCKIEIIPMNKYHLEFNGVKSNFNSAASFYPLKAASLFPQYKKMIYLDGRDTVVLKDLQELYDQDFTDKNFYYLGKHEENGKKYERESVGDTDVYINTGVLLMNLDKLREDLMESHFQSFLMKNTGRHIPLGDQTVINAVCKGRIGVLPAKYGWFPVNSLQQTIDEFRNGNCISYMDCLEAFYDPAIVHYFGLNKPEMTPWNLGYNHYYWYYASKTKYFEKIMGGGIENFSVEDKMKFLHEYSIYSDAKEDNPKSFDDKVDRIIILCCCLTLCVMILIKVLRNNINIVEFIFDLINGKINNNNNVNNRNSRNVIENNERYNNNKKNKRKNEISDNSNTDINLNSTSSVINVQDKNEVAIVKGNENNENKE